MFCIYSRVYILAVKVFNPFFAFASLSIQNSLIFFFILLKCDFVKFVSVFLRDNLVEMTS